MLGSGVIIAVIDTGVDYNHEDLKGKVILGKDYVNNDNDPMDDVGHGTHVAGIAAALSNNNTGIAGVAWDSRILAVKTIGPKGGTSLNFAKGVVYAVNKGAKVINYSASGPKNIFKFLAVTYADIRNRLVVAAAGNDNCSNPEYPAAYSCVL